MNPPALSLQACLLLAVAAAALAGTFLVWSRLIGRWRRGWPLVPYQPRRRVPWRGWDVLLVVVFYGLAVWLATQIATMVVGAEASAPLLRPPGAGPVHPVMRLLSHGDLWVQLLAALTAVVVAPLAEECFFRVLLQGWLEAAERRRRRELPTLHRLLPFGALPVIASSLVFAWLHARPSDIEYRLPYVTAMLVGQMVASLLATALALGWMRLQAGATLGDLGWDARHLSSDVRTGLVAFAAVAVPTYAIQFLALNLLPEGVVADPVPLLFFALVLGGLYYRTHRIMPGLVLHVALNACSLLLWLAGAG
jgi:membrane protease YdiL (CAAX protease family)